MATGLDIPREAEGSSRNSRTRGDAPRIADRDWLAIDRALNLSDQQREITRLIVEENLNDAAIALRLGVTKGSIEKQVQRMYRNLRSGGHEVRSRAALVSLVWGEFWRMREERCCG